MKAISKRAIRKAYGDLEQMHASLELINDADSDAYEGKSDSWKESDKGQAEQEKLSQLEEALGYIYDAMQALDNATQEDEA